MRQVIDLSDASERVLRKIVEAGGPDPDTALTQLVGLALGWRPYPTDRE